MLQETVQKVVTCNVSFYNLNCTLSELTQPQRVVLICVFTIIITITVVGNILTIVSILYFRQLQTRTNVLALSLALADFLVGCLIMPFSVMRTAYSCWFYGQLMCRIHTWLDYTFTTCSIFNLACISIDRYVAISDPLRYDQRVTYRILAVMLTICWGNIIPYGVSYMLKLNINGIESVVAAKSCPDNCSVFMNVPFGLANSMGAYVLPMLFIMAAYSRIYVMARNQAKRISSLGDQVRASNASDLTMQSKWNAMKRDHNATKTLGMIMVVLFIVWLPFIVVVATEPVIGYRMDSTVWDVANWFTYFNSTMNPILFASFNNSFRSAFYLIMSGKILRGSYRGTDLFNFRSSCRTGTADIIQPGIRMVYMREVEPYAVNLLLRATENKYRVRNNKQQTMKTHNATNTLVAPVCVVTFFNFNCSPPDLGDGERDILIGGFSLVIATTALGNILTITSILYFRQLQTRTNAFAISLATADLLVGVMVMPYAVTRTAYTCWFYGKTFCKMHTWFDYTLTTSSILHLACISIDRYVAISDPLRYEQRVTKKLVGRMLVFCWTSFIIYGLSYMLEWNIAGIEDIVASSTCPHNCPVFMNVQFALTNTLCAYVTPMLLMLAAYAKVYVMARAQARKISIAMLQTRSADAAVRSRWSAMKREHSATKTLGIIMGAFVVFWVPFFVVAASEPLLGYASDPLVWDVANWFTYINSTMNPILFAAFNRSFRNAFYLIVSGKILHGSYRGTDLFSFKRGSGVAEMA
ncbi:unnamed protein product [Lampetra planeri]